MTTTTERTFANSGDRYEIDCLLVPAGWAQLDTAQDASYHGVWAHPGHQTVVSYCEGDITRFHADTAEEFVAEVRRIAAWHERMDGWLKIDPCNGSKEAWQALGLGGLLF